MLDLPPHLRNVLRRWPGMSLTGARTVNRVDLAAAPQSWCRAGV
jgi:hypothetical protein